MASSFPEILTVPKAISSTVCARVSPRIPSVRITRRPSQRIHSASNGDRNVSIAASEAAERREARLRELIAEQMAQVEEEEKPYRFVDGRKYYLDELDIPGFLDGSRYLRPSDPETYNPAVFLWKKIGDIPEERRHRLLGLLKPHHITLMWDAAGNRFQLEQEDGEEGADPVTSAGGMLPDVATGGEESWMGEEMRGGERRGGRVKKRMGWEGEGRGGEGRAEGGKTRGAEGIGKWDEGSGTREVGAEGRRSRGEEEQRGGGAEGRRSRGEEEQRGGGAEGRRSRGEEEQRGGGAEGRRSRGEEEQRGGGAEGRRSRGEEEQRGGGAEGRRSRGEEEQRGGGAEGRRSRGEEEQRGGGAEGRRSRGEEEQRGGGAERRRSRGEEEQRGGGAEGRRSIVVAFTLSKVISGGPLFTGLSNVITPLYFRIRAATNVLATDEPCDLSFDYESGQLHLKDSGLPEGFPDPRELNSLRFAVGPGGARGDSGAVVAGGQGGEGVEAPLPQSILLTLTISPFYSSLSPPTHPTPLLTSIRPHPPIFDDDFRDYVRAAGPGVIVGQSWQEGREVDAEPRQFLGEFILVRRHPHQVNVLY
ncbi:unnamed protein product [Closterium sp. NIES-65]|nr:unnamed protein product [Closterium sp. NIES-65]